MRAFPYTIVGLITLTAFPHARAGDDPRDAVFALEQRRIEVIERVSPACVCILDELQNGGGSGVVIDEEGYGLTNFHVVAGMMGSRKGLAGLNDGKLYTLEVLGIDVTGDVAMFRLTGKDRFAFAELGDSDAVRVGDEAIAIGNPFTLASDYHPTVTLGIVSGLHRYQGESNTLVYTDCIQTDASINPGNSGGPLFDRDGKVIGINGRISAEMHKYARGRFNVGLGYAISINQIKRFIPHLRAGLLGRHGTLDATVTDDADRVVFDNMYEDGPAWNAGIRVGDGLLRFGGEDIRSANHFASLLGTYPERWPVPITFESRGRVKHQVVRLESIMPQMNRPYETPPKTNALAVKETLHGFAEAVLGAKFPETPRVWSWWAVRIAGDKTTVFTITDEPGGKLERFESAEDGTERRIEVEDGKVALIEGGKRYLADKDESLLITAMQTLRRQVLVGAMDMIPSGARHLGGDALTETDHDGRITRTRLLETIRWPMSDEVELHVGFELDTGLPARVVVRDAPTDRAVEIELDDYREAGGIVWPHRMRVVTSSGRFDEGIGRLDIEW